MQTVKQSPKCPQCLDHDHETRDLVQKLYSDDEVTFLTMLVGSTLQYRTEVMNKMPTSDINRLMVQRELDFGGCILGKFVVSLNDQRRMAIIQALRKIGVVLNLQHEVCPHQAVRGVTADTPVMDDPIGAPHG